MRMRHCVRDQGTIPGRRDRRKRREDNQAPLYRVHAAMQRAHTNERVWHQHDQSSDRSDSSSSKRRAVLHEREYWGGGRACVHDARCCCCCGCCCCTARTKLSMPEMSPAETPSFEGYVTSAPSSKKSGVVAPRKAEAAQNSTCVYVYVRSSSCTPPNSHLDGTPNWTGPQLGCGERAEGNKAWLIRMWCGAVHAGSISITVDARRGIPPRTAGAQGAMPSAGTLYRAQKAAAAQRRAGADRA
jgi:hypothetical protein